MTLKDFPQKLKNMKRYEAMTGKRIEAHYRASDFRLSAAGRLVLDTGESIFIEEHFSQGGKQKTSRLEIPYEYILRIVEAADEPASSARADAPMQKNSS